MPTILSGCAEHGVRYIYPEIFYLHAALLPERCALSDHRQYLGSKEFAYGFSPVALEILVHCPPFLSVTHERSKTVDAVDEFSVGHGDEQRKHHAEMQRQERAHRRRRAQKQ